MTLILTWLVCFAAGGLGSEMVQSLLPVSGPGGDGLR